jgi:hypothetical protein
MRIGKKKRVTRRARMRPTSIGVASRCASVGASPSRKELLFNAAPGYQGNEGRYAGGVAQTRDFPVHQRLHFACIATSLFSENSHGGVVGLWQPSVCIHVDQWLYPIPFTKPHSIPLDFLLRCGGGGAKGYRPRVCASYFRRLRRLFKYCRSFKGHLGNRAMPCHAVALAISHRRDLRKADFPDMGSRRAPTA